ncbi:transcriptional regulator, AraC family [Chitinophaga jiangningensis]|uniref:Transcriptional regulator, AraC family n=1 Tax=Chitinophaga jiangningensis TaxID=1419482 RepID=A0A1M7ILV8_9BACT|nr:helix-turn-helix domain-containing protein [Chitinophaga jiangningensis]SHM41691.1 transcriptional regulator, AraC family [Chitinophaga jiangningensis]
MLTLSKGHFLGQTSTSFAVNEVMISRTAYHAPVFEGWHCHEHLHLTLLLEGGNEESRSGSCVEVMAGNLLWYHSGEMHRNAKTRHPSVNINLEIPEVLLRERGLSFHTLTASPLLQDKAKYAMLKLLREITIADMHTGTAVDALLNNIFTAPAVKANIPPQWVATVAQLLQDRWADTVSLDEMAAAAGVHPVTISKYFPSYFGCSLGYYLRKIKIDRALVLLRTGKYSLTEVAYRCGFFDQSHFIRVFKSHTGMLPKVYRQL